MSDPAIMTYEFVTDSGGIEAIEVTIRSNNVRLPRCEKERPDDPSQVCIVMLYGNLPHDFPCMWSDRLEDAYDPKIISNVKRIVSYADAGVECKLVPDDVDMPRFS